MWRVLMVLSCVLAGCATPSGGRFEDRQEIEGVLGRANRGFELSDPLGRGGVGRAPPGGCCRLSRPA